MSAISILVCISDLLFERKQIVLPGIGLLGTKLTESAVDQVQGVIHPPSKEITFNSNITADDGVLVDFIMKKYKVEEITARTALADFTNDLRLRMHKKEIVSIPDVGRLYLDFEKNIQFLPDRVNYNKDAFGLPALNYYPILQDKKADSEPQSEGAATPIEGTSGSSKLNIEKTVIPPSPATQGAPVANTPVPASKNETPETVIPPSPRAEVPVEKELPGFMLVLNKIFPFLLIISIAVAAYVFYDYWKNSSEPPLFEEDKLEEIRGNKRLNQSPGADEDAQALYEENEIIEKTNEGMTEDDSDEFEEADTPEYEEETPEPAAKGKRGIIIIGGFSESENASKLVEKIQRKGFSPYTDLKGVLTRVGVEFRYNSVAELDDMHRQIQREFNDGAWILEPK